MKSITSKLRVIGVVGALSIIVPMASAGTGTSGSVAHAATDAATRSISSAGTSSFQNAGTGSGDLQYPEFPGNMESDSGPTPYGGTINDRSASRGSGQGVSIQSGAKAKSNPEMGTSFDGLNFRQQRLANHGNQFSVEPPDQGLCAGNGFVMESVNDVLRVFDTSGNPVTGVVDLNTFYGYAAAINRSTGARGPFVTDPSCYYDQATQRWFQVVLTLDVNPKTGAYLGSNHLDMAVSQTSDPTKAWTIYRLPVQDDGTQGTPNHGCVGGPCFGDYPHIGADANGFYITTNEYDFFGNGFHGAQIYAFSKAALAAGVANVQVTQFDTATTVAGFPGFTLWPATSPDTPISNTEYFMSSNATDEAQCPSEAQTCTGSHISSQLLVWTLSNTSSLNGASPSLSLSYQALSVNPYAVPPKADQKAGDFPLGQCLNDTSCSTFLIGRPDPYAPEVQSHLDSNDTRMQQVTFANGKLWGALDTAVTMDGVNKAGIEYFVVNPIAGKVNLQGYLGLANNNLTYPAIGVTPSGRGVMAFTVTGADYYPSAGYASIDAKVGAGDIHVAQAGAGPDDGFTSYKAEVGNPPRTRWGDYGYSAVVGNTVWMASEYIGQTCTLAQYVSAPFGSCGGTRATLGNWDTRITQVTP